MHGFRWASRLITPVVILVLTGCHIGVPGQPKTTPTPLPADQAVFQVEAYGGLVPPLVLAFSGPALVVYGDGRVIQFVDENRPYDSPPAYSVSMVNSTAVAEFAAEAEASDLINDRTDFGTPGVTDLPFTTVRLHDAGGERSVQVYAFDEAFEKDVSALQARNRRRLAELIDRAYALPGDAALDPYQPEQVRVLELDASYGQDTDAPPWPGPDPDSFLTATERRYPGIACGLLTGEEATSVYAAALDNRGARWTFDDRHRVLAVLPLLPGSAIGCAR